MPQAIPVVFTLAATLATKSAVWHILAYVAGALIASTFTDESPTLDTSGGRNVMTNSRATRTPLKIVYGECRVGGNDVFAIESGEDNKYLWVVQTLSEGEIKGVKKVDDAFQLYLNDKLIDELNEDGSSIYPWSYASYWVHEGSSTQTADPRLFNAVEYTECYRNTAYIVWRFRYNPDIFTALPRRTAVVEGRLLYDIRDGTTWYNANPVLVLYDYMTSTRYGMGIDSDFFDVSSWQDGANYCDSKGWETNIALYLDRESARDIVNKLLTYFRGALVWYNGKIYLRYADLNVESVSMALTDDLLCRREDGRAMISIHQPSKVGVPDGIRVSYVDPNKDYVSDEFPVGEEEGVIEPLNLPGCNNREHAGNIAIYQLERQKLNRSLSGVWRDDAIKLDPHDLVTLNSDLLGMYNQTLRVQKSNVVGPNLVELTLIWESTALYNDTYDTDIEDVYDTDIVSPMSVPPNVRNVTFTEQPYYIKGLTYERLVINWEIPNNYPFVDHIEIWVSQDEQTWVHWGVAYDSCDFKPVNETEKWYFKLRVVNVWGRKQDLARVSIWVHDVLGYVGFPGDVIGFHALIAEDKTHLSWDHLEERNVKSYSLRWGNSWRGSFHLFDIKDTAKSLIGIKPGDHMIWIAAETELGKFSSNPQYVNFTVYIPTHYVELFSYEYDFTTGTFFGTEKWSNPTYDDPLRVDRGLDSATSWNTWTGSNESILWTDKADDGDTWVDLMRNLTGYWESAEADLGQLRTVRIWTLFELAAILDMGNTWNDWFDNDDTMLWTELFTYEAMTWEDIGGYGSGVDSEMTWNKFLLYDDIRRWLDKIPTSEHTWSQLFQVAPAGDVYMILYYKKYVSDAWSEARNFEIFSMEIEARYLKYRIYLEDNDVNTRMLIKAPAILKGYYWRS
jgi:hypothetical protein